MSKLRVSQLPEGMKLTITQYGEGRALEWMEGSRYLSVSAPIPSDFGLSVGSSYSDPMNQMLGEGSGAALAGLRMAGRLGGVSRKLGFNTKVFYDGPEPTEISFDLEFNSYYSAYNEVVMPIARLMLMSVGRDKSAQEIAKALKDAGGVDDNKYFDLFNEAVGQGGEFLTGDPNGIGLIFSPGVCRISFGNTLHIERCYISSVAARFSNTFDNEFLPISGKASVTVKLELNPGQRQVIDMLRHVNRGRQV